MENSSRRILDEILPLISSIKGQISQLEDKLAELQHAAETEGEIVSDSPSDSPDSPDSPDLSDLSDSPDSSVESVAGSLPEPVAGNEENLFSEEEMDQEYPAGPVVLDVNDLMRDAGHLSVMDVLADREAWRKDRPGQPVKDVRSAISLNDRALFIRTLFREDPLLFSSTMEELNTADSLQSAVSFLAGRFPEWDMESDAVYRFMMCIRRKVG